MASEKLDKTLTVFMDNADLFIDVSLRNIPKTDQGKYKLADKSDKVYQDLVLDVRSLLQRLFILVAYSINFEDKLVEVKSRLDDLIKASGIDKHVVYEDVYNTITKPITIESKKSSSRQTDLNLFDEFGPQVKPQPGPEDEDDEDDEEFQS